MSISTTYDASGWGGAWAGSGFEAAYPSGGGGIGDATSGSGGGWGAGAPGWSGGLAAPGLEVAYPSGGGGIRIMDEEAASLAFGLNQTPRGAELYRWLDRSPFLYEIYGNLSNAGTELPSDVYGRYLPGLVRNECSANGGGRVLVDSAKARANGLTPARVFGHELTHAGLHDQKIRNMPFVPDVVFRYIKYALPKADCPGNQT